MLFGFELTIINLLISVLLWRQFIDLCILLGCDYLEPIKGVGPKTALKLIREHGGLKEVLEYLKEKYVPT